MATTDIETKIAKLLAKAEGTTNAHEAEAFMAQAEKLMLKYGIDQANLEATKPGAAKQEVVVVTVPVPDGHGYAIALVALATYIAPNFSVRMLQSAMPKNGKMLWFIGHRSDVDDAIRLFNSLSVQGIAQAKHWWRTEGKPGFLWVQPTDNDAYLARREFIYAFGRGAGSRLAETRNQVVAEAGAGTELVLVDRAKLVDNWIDRNLQVSQGRKTTRRTGVAEARSAGYESGRNAVNGKALGR